MQVEEFDYDDDLASASDSDIDVVPSHLGLQAPAGHGQPTQPQPQSQSIQPVASTAAFVDASIVLSEEDEEEEDTDEGDFEDLANDLEVSLAGQGPFAGPPLSAQTQQNSTSVPTNQETQSMPPQPARTTTAGKKISKSQPFMDSDIASSSESDSDNSASD